MANQEARVSCRCSRAFVCLAWPSSYVSATLQERFARKNEAAELHRAFTTLDRNHDGVIDAEELNALFLDMGHKAKKVSSSATTRSSLCTG